jgi:hypothetical protein
MDHFAEKEKTFPFKRRVLADPAGGSPIRQAALRREFPFRQPKKSLSLKLAAKEEFSL